MKKTILVVLLFCSSWALAQTDPAADLEVRTYDVAQGNNGILYLGSSVGMMIVNATDPGNIIKVGRMILPDNVNQMEVHENVVIASNGEAGISFINVTDPVKPIKLFSIDTAGSVQFIKTYRGSLLVCDGGMGLRILRVDNSSAITESRVRLQGFAKRLIVDGNYTFIACDHGGLACVDLTDMTTPKILWLNESPDRTRDVAVAGDLLLSAEGRGGLLIYDISDVGNPKLLKSFAVRDMTRFVTVRDGIAYLSEGPDGIRIIRLGNGPDAEVIGHLDTPSAALRLTFSKSNNDILFMAMDGGGVRSVDISDVSNPILISRD